MSNLFRKLCFSASSLAIAIPAAAPISAQTSGLSYADTQRCANTHQHWATQGAGSDDDWKASKLWRDLGRGEFPDISEEDRSAGIRAGIALSAELGKLPATGEDRMIFLMRNMTECLKLRTANIGIWLRYERGDGPAPKTAPAAISTGPIASGYHYALTDETAMYCGIHANFLSYQYEESDPARAKQLNAIGRTWFAMADDLTGNDKAKLDALFDRMAGPSADVIDNAVANGADMKSEITGKLKFCAVLRGVHYSDYRAKADGLTRVNEDLYGNGNALASQTGIEPSGATPTKELSFGDWSFRAKNSSCMGEVPLDGGAKLIFGFTNFKDGRITLADADLPGLDYTSDESAERDEAAHRAGADSDEDYNPVIADGFTYASYPGTALFVDDALVAEFYQWWEGREPTSYTLGALQDSYYDLLPAGKVATIKVLGEEKHRFDIGAEPEFWNEMSRCIAQYPND